MKVLYTFPVWPALRLYEEDHLPLGENDSEEAVGGWSEMTANLGGREPGNRGTATAGRRCQDCL
jgi:hypothetical protein